MKHFFCIAFLLANVATVCGAILGPTASFKRDIGPKATPEDLSIFGICISIGHIDIGYEFEIQASISSKREIRNLRVTLEQGEYGTSSYLRAVLFSASTLSSPAKLPPITIGRKNSSASIHVWAQEYSGDRLIKLYDSVISISDLLSSNPNKTSEPTPPSGSG